MEKFLIIKFYRSYTGFSDSDDILEEEYEKTMKKLALYAQKIGRTLHAVAEDYLSDWPIVVAGDSFATVEYNDILTEEEMKKIINLIIPAFYIYEIDNDAEELQLDCDTVLKKVYFFKKDCTVFSL